MLLLIGKPICWGGGADHTHKHPESPKTLPPFPMGQGGH